MTIEEMGLELELGGAGMVAVHHSNSIDFVKAAFDVYNSGNVLVVLKQQTAGFKFIKEVRPDAGGGWFELYQDVIQEDRPAQIVFTSGTEGEPKAILLSHRALADVVIRLNGFMHVDSSIREYIGIPVTYSFGFGRCRAISAAGGRGFIPDNGFNPVEIAGMLEEGQINAISAVPTQWRAVLKQPEIIGKLGERVKWIEIGSQYMSKGEKEKLKALFPMAVIVQHYGLTEASRSTLLKISKTQGEQLESVGETVGDVEIRISPEKQIQIRGPHVAMGRVKGGEIFPIVDDDGWYTTGDVGRIENNHVYFEGRSDDIINCGGMKLSPDLLQDRLNRKLKADNSLAVCKIPDDLRGDGVLVAVEYGAGLDCVSVLELADRELQEMGINAKSAIKVEQIDAIPRTDTGKVMRKALASQFVDRHLQNEVNGKSKYMSVSDIYAGIFRGCVIRKEDTFRSLGGDSLNYIEMIMLLEKYLGYAPSGWERMSIDELEKLKKMRTVSIYDWVDTSVFLRAIAIVGVVATHSGMMMFGGGTMLLFMLIGYNLARFKFEEFTESGVWKWLKSYALFIFIPYYAFAVLYGVENKTFEVSRWLQYGNFVNDKLTILFPFWFVQSLTQSLILVGFLFSFDRTRKLAKKFPLRFSLGILFVLMVIRFLYQIAWEAAYENGIYGFEHNDMLPFRLVAIMWLGWVIYLASKSALKLLVCLAGILFAFLDTAFLWGFGFDSPQTGVNGATKWLVAGSVILTFFNRIPVPAFSKNMINDIGSAALFIFVFNGAFIKFSEKILHIESKPVLLLISLVGSMAIWWLSMRVNFFWRISALTKLPRRKNISIKTNT